MVTRLVLYINALEIAHFVSGEYTPISFNRSLLANVTTVIHYFDCRSELDMLMMFLLLSACFCERRRQPVCIIVRCTTPPAGLRYYVTR